MFINRLPIRIVHYHAKEKLIRSEVGNNAITNVYQIFDLFSN